MSAPSLAELEFLPVLDADGLMPDTFDGKVGVYAIFDAAKILQYVGYSRDVSLSLKQHLVRQPQSCYWFKVQTIDRPSRSILEATRDAWIGENGAVPLGNAAAADLWNQPIDAKPRMTTAEQTAYESSDEPGKIKALKQVARRIEIEVMQDLEARGVKLPIRFDPKAKESGLLNLK
ncbi:MAG: GIY-YIG nuclease family protein [Pegethrix bostrychoides GSE-TBD4-15B]|jgi:hypothetical protein|uniref:GIY-YIG nuclease family protein n=1 Tax=Pegethrix bostrychoides GSE-TBD4-15B TaxID=2839662 RepID=A0A951PD41_9CYAN|nr:GIY-YIG nuclease family protein [Pegethrix bostrychoides GSE-TBD4-15B]